MSIIYKSGGGAYPVNSVAPAGMTQGVPLISPTLMKRIKRRLGVSVLTPTVDVMGFLEFINDSVERHLDYLDAADAKVAADREKNDEGDNNAGNE